MGGYIDISPGGNHFGWIGNEPSWSGGSNTGAWFKKVWIGGTSLATAKIVADASGNLLIDGSAIISGTLSVAQLTGWNGGSVNVGAGGMTFTDGSFSTVIRGNDISTAEVTAVQVNASSFTVPFAGPGITATKVVVDAGGVPHTVTISAGIITGWT